MIWHELLIIFLLLHQILKPFIATKYSVGRLPSWPTSHLYFPFPSFSVLFHLFLIFLPSSAKLTSVSYQSSCLSLHIYPNTSYSLSTFFPLISSFPFHISISTCLFTLFIPPPSPSAGVQAEGDAGNALRGHLASWFHRWPGYRLVADQRHHVRWRLGRRAVPLQVRLNHRNKITHRSLCVLCASQSVEVYPEFLLLPLTI